MVRKPVRKTPASPRAGRPRRKPAAPAYKASADELLQFHRAMLLIRRFEEKAGQMYGMGLIGGFCHLYIGQEAVAVGVQSALGPDDTVITSYRAHGHLLAAGLEPQAVMAELTGRAGGVSRGKGGSMHMFAPDKGFFGGHGIVGAQASIGTGLAFAHRAKDKKAVSVTYFGDGAANQGQVYESFNMAEIWNLPVLYVIENNQYAMGTSVSRSSAQTQLSRRGDSFRIPGTLVDGMDVLAVRAAVDDGLAWCRAGKGPRILEMKTYRYRGHSMSDPAKYRSRDEVKRMRAEHDPIDQVRRRIVDSGAADEAALKQVDSEIKALVAAAADFARTSPEPSAEELYTDVVV